MSQQNSEIMKRHKFSIKVVLVGNSGVGKTSIVSSYLKRSFDTETLPTVAPASCTTTINIDDENSVELQIWDTAGQERFQSISKMFYRDAKVAFVCYDKTCEDSVESWIERINENVSGCHIFMVLTKIDTISPEEMSNLRESGHRLQEKFKVDRLVLTSAKTRFGIDALFMDTAQFVKSLFAHNAPTIEITEQKKNSSCC